MPKIQIPQQKKKQKEERTLYHNDVVGTDNGDMFLGVDGARAIGSCDGQLCGGRGVGLHSKINGPISAV
jgi:hypothetical protein